MTTTNCANCNSHLSEQAKFCSECGQKTNLHRLSLHDVYHDAIHYFTHADKGFLQLLKALVTKTGTIANEYVAGKRKKYFAPLNFYLIVAGLLVIMNNMFHSPPNEPPRRTASSSQYERPLTQEQIATYKAMRARAMKAQANIGKYSNIIAMIAAPLLALLWRLFYLKGKYNYTEHLVAGLYMTGFTNLCYGLIFIPVSSLLHIEQNLYFIAALIVFQVVYISIFYYHFINQGTKASAWKAAGVGTFVILLWSSLSSGLITLYIVNGFWGLMH